MKSIAIGSVTEVDVNSVVEGAGGRCNNIRSGSNEPSHADYVFPDAVIELKLISEEGLSKTGRRDKLAALFSRSTQPVIVLDPAVLPEETQNTYYNLLLGPVQTAVKKAAQQISETESEVGGTPARILLIINIGYTAVDHSEFKRLVLKSARNDTSKIDAVIVGGIYHYGDGFESFVICPFELCQINVGRVFSGFARLHSEWNKFCEKMITAALLGTSTTQFNRLPLVDLVYEHKGITYVKPAKQMGKASGFWIRGRPRANSTGSEQCPQVGVAFPVFDAPTWEKFHKEMPDSSFLRNSYAEWRIFSTREQSAVHDVEQPLVPVEMHFEPWISWCDEREVVMDDEAIFTYALEQLDANVRKLIFEACDLDEMRVLPSSYVHLVTEEIGQDCALDLSYAYLIGENVYGGARLSLFEHRRLFFEHALVLAATYAVRHCVPVLTFRRDQTYMWS